MTLATFLSVILVLVAVSVILLGRLFHWSARRQVWTTVGVYPAVLTCTCFAAIFGFLSPIQELSMQWKIRSLESHLYIGETKAQVEHHFDHDIPKPDTWTSEYEGTDPSPLNIAKEHNWVRYYYLSDSAFCFAGYQGVEVQYDSKHQVRGWQRSTHATGC